MNDVLPFQRARKPEEQQQRREAILAAAADLFDAEGPLGAGLNAIAAKAGFTKSNIYRYFESREEVLMNLFLGEFEAFVPAFEARVAACPSGDVDTLAAAGALSFIERPRFCLLMSMLSSVVEQNVSEAAIVTLKRQVAALSSRTASAIAAKLPGAKPEECGWAIAMAATLVAGMWPAVKSSSAAAKVLAMPEFQHLKPVPERDLARAIRALLASVA